MAPSPPSLESPLPPPAGRRQNARGRRRRGALATPASSRTADWRRRKARHSARGTARHRRIRRRRLLILYSPPALSPARPPLIHPRHYHPSASRPEGGNIRCSRGHPRRRGPARMGSRAHEAPGRAPRQPRVGARGKNAETKWCSEVRRAPGPAGDSPGAPAARRSALCAAASTCEGRRRRPPARGRRRGSCGRRRRSGRRRGRGGTGRGRWARRHASPAAGRGC